MLENAPNPFQLQDENDFDGTINLDEAKSATIHTPLNNSKEAEIARLQAREAELLARQKRIQDGQFDGNTSNKPTWPPYVPFLHIDLENEIPAAAHNCIKFAKIGVLLCIGQALINIIASCSISGLPSYSHASGIVWSFIFAFLNGYLTISVNFSRLYSSCRAHDIPFSFLLFQFVLIGFLVYQLIGFPNSGSVGFATFLDLIAKSKSGWSKFISFFNTILILSCAVVQFIVLQQSQKYQKVSGHDEHGAPAIGNLETINV
ncbi:hypothetical protein TRFO_39875 [Tritrichomonas foetus]|uniref:Secretory carrier membrane protein n=1 Tax=Tritrichomonas foetus TaxID=1144522 RepID=A0A1J4J6X7_9EUKA|nr:hypothetical protein TRFO_39875 [Tritrichomonas foetus]|eukprot:OHS93943.1 hypothetical protein TRFO_39875 [Tritrichomonas foetus]